MRRMEQNTAVTESPPDPLIRRADAIRELDVTERTFDRWRDAGRITPAVTPRPGVWFRQADVDALKVQ